MTIKNSQIKKTFYKTFFIVFLTLWSFPFLNTFFTLFSSTGTKLEFCLDICDFFPALPKQNNNKNFREIYNTSHSLLCCHEDILCIQLPFSISFELRISRAIYIFNLEFQVMLA
jgi:hypothetical protein